MTTKPYHGVTLWAVPRFHRSDFTPLQPAPATAPTALHTYSFSLAEAPPPQIEDPRETRDQLQICH